MPDRKIPFLTFLVLLLSIGHCAVADGPQLVVRPDSVFFRQVGSTAPSPVQIGVSSSGGTLGAFTASASVKNPAGGNWLTVSPTGGNGPTILTASVNTANLGPGEYDAVIIITAEGFANSPFRVNVELEILNAPGIRVRPDELEFHVVQGGPAPPPRPVTLSNPLTATFNWTAAATLSTPPGGTWLSVSPNNGTGNAVLLVSVNPTGLTKGEFKGQITVTSGTSTAKVDVELEVEGPREPKLVIVPRAFNFIVEPNSTQAPAPKTLEVKNTGGGTLTWNASVTVHTPPNGTWLSLSSTTGSTPAKITLKADPTGLSQGMYSASVIVTSGKQSQEARVFLRILGPTRPKVLVRPKSLRFTATGGVATPASRTVTIDSKATGLTFTAKATTAKGGDWLKITSASSGAVPGSITVSTDNAVVATLAPGVYTGNIEIKVSGAAQEVHNVLVALKVVPPGEPPRLEAEPGGLAFTAKQGGSNPAAKTVELEAEGAASIPWTAAASTTSGGSWLTVAPPTGTATPAASSKVSVSVNITGLLAAGSPYSGTVVFTPAASTGAPPVSVRVRLVVTSPTEAPTAQVSSITAQISNPTAADVTGPLVAVFTEPADNFITQVDLPLNVSVTVLDANGTPVEGATVVVSSSGKEPDLVLTDVGGGNYTGVFRALSSGILTLTGSAQVGSLTAPSFAVSGDMESATATLVFQNGAVSAASFAASPTPLAAGSLLSVFGLNLAGNGGAASGIPLPATLGGASVTIGGVATPLVAAVPSASDQINLQIPFELSGVAQADIVVNNNGVLTIAETIALAPAVPALFTFSQNGDGPGAILHADFTPVNANSPATANEVILLFATGLGALDPPVLTGYAPAGLSKAVGNVTLTIGGQTAEVQFAGAAPNFVGLNQINVKVPAGLPAGDALVVVSVDGTPATGRATVALR